VVYCTGLDPADQEAALVRECPSLSENAVQKRFACQARAFAGRRYIGVIESASLAGAMIGQGLALARGRLTKHAVPLDALASGKQVDRLRSNPGIDVDALLIHWVPYVVGDRSSITVAMDWADFDADGQTTIMLSLLCRHGRATPLMWLTIGTATLKDRRNDCEDQVLMRLAAVLPAAVHVRIVADRGFGDQKLCRMLTDELKFDFVICFRGKIKVITTDGEARPTSEWVGVGGRARALRGATVTASGYPVATVVCVQAKDMKQPWCLAASVTNETARAMINLFGKRKGIECAFRDTIAEDDPSEERTAKLSPDLRFGMGIGAMHVSTPDRRNRLWLINAFAVVLLTLLGMVGEVLGYDRHLKSNTSTRRTHSLFRQGSMLYEPIATMSEHYLWPLIKQFAHMLAAQRGFNEMFGATRE